MDLDFEFESCLDNKEKIKPTVNTITVDDYDVKIIDDLISKNEMSYMLDKKNFDTDGWIDSKVECSWKNCGLDKDGTSTYDTQHRKSKSVWLNDERKDPVISCLRQRFAKISNKEADHIEPLQIIKYNETDFFHSHFDSLSHSPETCADVTNNLHDKLCTPDGDPVLRETTLFVILQTQNLNDSDLCGGKTIFDNIVNEQTQEPLGVPAKPGRGILFNNLTKDDKKHRLSLHRGETLKCSDSQKVGMNIWFNRELSKEQVEQANF